jgi:diphthine-ammonia ligase
MTIRKAALCFTGGKDCTLALHRTIDSGKYDISLLVTFAPANMQKFKAHPLSVVQMQTQSLGIPHRVYLVDGPDFLGSYQKHITSIKEEYGIDALVTGKVSLHRYSNLPFPHFKSGLKAISWMCVTVLCLGQWKALVSS